MRMQKPTAAKIVDSKARAMVTQMMTGLIAELPVEDVLFLQELVVNYNSMWPGDSLGIVNAFENLVGDRGCYILLPDAGMQDQVMEYIQEVTERKGRFQPRGNGWHLWKNPSTQAENRKAE